MELTTGTQIGHYRIVALLGKGGMGEVWLAQDEKLARQVALKLVPAEVAADAERLSRFQREARALAALNHPGIVTIHSIESADGLHFLTMERVEGRPLWTLIPRGGIPVDDLLALAIPLVDGVAAAHQKGIVHRDLKPSNVMVTAEGRVKVLDFGVAKLLEGDDGERPAPEVAAGETEEGRVLGTAAYMSPEQASGKAVDHRSDVFSLGVMLYEMSTGRRPFDGDSALEILAATIKDTPPPAHEVNPRVPRELARIVRRCLVKDPARRLQSALDLRNELEELKVDLDSGELESTSAPARGSTRRVLAASALALVLGALGAYSIGSVFLGRSAPAGNLEAQLTQVTHFAGLESEPSLSPDGKYVVYTAQAGGDLDLFLLRVGGENPQLLTADCAEDDESAAFSPDGRQIAFRSDRGGGGIFVMGATGESVRRVADTGYHPAWSADGREILFSTERVRSARTRYERSELQVVDVASGKSRRPVEGDAVAPVCSPHGKRIAYWASLQGCRDIWTAPLEGGPAQRVTDDAATDWDPVWSPDGSYLYFASDRSGMGNLCRVPIDEATGAVRGPFETVTSGTAESDAPSLSADGKRIAYRSCTRSGRLERWAFDPDTESVSGEPTSVVDGVLANADVSPDGQWLVYNSWGGQEDIYLIRTDGSQGRRLTDDVHRDRRPRWSPDGKCIAFTSNRSGHIEVWTIRPDGSGLSQVSRGMGVVTHIVWSPAGGLILGATAFDPKLVVLDGVDGTREVEIGRRTIHVDPGVYFVPNTWSSDGRRIAGELYDESGHTRGMGCLDVPSGACTTICDYNPFKAGWLPDSRRVVGCAERGVRVFDMETKEVRVVKGFPSSSDSLEIGTSALSPDGKWLYVYRMRTEADIWMMTLR